MNETYAELTLPALLEISAAANTAEAAEAAEEAEAAE
jgi:hypothetical protein